VITEVEITAHGDGRLRHCARGALSVRQTGARTIHLAATAAGPLDGDTVRMVVRVMAGARLRLHTVAATVVLAGCSSAVWQLAVDEGAALEVTPQPVVVTASARHHSHVQAYLTADATLLLTERVQLGRAAETGGRWTGRLHVDRDGAPLLRHEVSLGEPAPLVAARAMTSILRVPHNEPTEVRGNQVRMRLAAGGTLTTELDQELRSH